MSRASAALAGVLRHVRFVRTVCQCTGALITTSVLIALVYFIRKARIDDRWLLDRGFDREGQGS